MRPDGTVTGQYAFRHDLYQEVVYRRAGAGRRARWHLTIGRRKATSYGERDGEIATELAQHFEQGRDIAQAAHYRRLAAEKALRQNAYREASSTPTWVCASYSG